MSHGAYALKALVFSHKSLPCWRSCTRPSLLIVSPCSLGGLVAEPSPYAECMPADSGSQLLIAGQPKMSGSTMFTR
eukprot:scaffold8488_cov21-Tisochrysis_lutea.AAC.1